MHKQIVMLGLMAMMIVAIINCGKKVMIPPRIDLEEHEVIGMIQFKCSNEGKLASLATKRFKQAIREDQSMIRIVDLGTEKEVLKKIGSKKFDKAAFQAIGEEYGVKTIFLGDLDVSDIEPDIDIGIGFGLMEFNAKVSAELDVQMVETGSGASLWNASAGATKEIGGLSLMQGRVFSFDAEDPDQAYGTLVDALVWRTTYDFRVTWERR